MRNKYLYLIDAFDFERYLQDKVYPLKRRGEQEIRFNCPKCGDRKYNMYANIKTKRFHCFRADTCEWSISNPGIIRFVQEVDRCSFDRALEIVSQYANNIHIPISSGKVPLKSHIEELFEVPTSNTNLSNEYVITSLPEEMVSLFPKTEYTSPPLSYLRQRGVFEKDIIKYQIGYCVFGKYAKCVILPVVLRGRVVSFIARRIGKAGSYLRPENSDSWLFGLDQAIHADRLVVTEGPFDAMRVYGKFGGKVYAGVALLGTNLTPKHIVFLEQGDWERVIIALDRDASRKALKMVEHLQQKGIQSSVCLMDKDPSEYSSMELVQHIHNHQAKFHGKNWAEESIKAMFV